MSRFAKALRVQRRIVCMFVLQMGVAKTAFADSARLDRYVSQQQLWQNIQHYFDGQSPRDLSDFLAYVRDLNPSMFANYTLMPRSTSLHESDPLRPRAILFDAANQFVLSFNGDESQEGGSRVEMMLAIASPTETVERFAFFEAEFAKESSPKLSRENPEACTSCHQASNHLRPIWSEYPIWQNAYGRDDDTLSTGSKDYDSLVQFNALKQQHPRYKFLVTTNDETIAPFSQIAFNSDYSRRPNLQLTKLLAYWNASYLSATIREKLGQMPEERAAMSRYSLAECYKFASDTDDEFLDHVFSAKLESHLDLIKREIIKPVRTGFHGESHKFDVVYQQLAQLGVEFADWHLDNDRPQDYEYYEGINTMVDLILAYTLDAELTQAMARSRINLTSASTYSERCNSYRRIVSIK